MAIISLGKIDQKIIQILLGFVFNFISRFGSFSGTKLGSKLMEHPIILNLSISIAKFFNIIPLIIIKIRSKKVLNSDIEKKTKIFNEYEYYYKKRNPKIKINMFIIFYQQ